MSAWRGLRKYGPEIKGIAIGWLIGPQVDAKILAALPGWAVSVTVEGPAAVTSADLAAARLACKAPANVPVILFGWSAGCQAVRTCLVANLVDPWGVAVFDGTAGQCPPEPWQIQVWADLMTRARAGLGHFVATATMMTYTKDIPAGTPGRAWPTSWVLARALGQEDGTLKPGAPIADGNLYVEIFPSAAIDKAAHIREINEVAPLMLAKLANMAGGPDPVPLVQPPAAHDADEAPPPWRDPSNSIAERLALWAEQETATWKDNGWTETPPGSNDSPRIREYAGLPYHRRASGAALSGLRNVAWCAEGASFGVATVLLPGESQPLAYRVSGIEIEQDARANHVLQTDVRQGKRGDVMICKHQSANVPDWARHVLIVLGITETGVWVTAGNDGNTWTESTIPFSDPLFVGYVPIG